jgi:hypothetical protein
VPDSLYKCTHVFCAKRVHSWQYEDPALSTNFKKTITGTLLVPRSRFARDNRDIFVIWRYIFVFSFWISYISKLCFLKVEIIPSFLVSWTHTVLPLIKNKNCLLCGSDWGVYYWVPVTVYHSFDPTVRPAQGWCPSILPIHIFAQQSPSTKLTARICTEG